MLIGAEMSGMDGVSLSNQRLQFVVSLITSSLPSPQLMKHIGDVTHHSFGASTKLCQHSQLR